jgi:hypothetical protein
LASFIKLCGDIADMCARADANFDRRRFLEACGCK